MMMFRPIAALALVTTAACFGYRPVETAPTTGATVRVTLNGPSVIPTELRGVRDSSEAVVEAIGTVRALSADTLTLALGELRRDVGPLPGLSGSTAFVPRTRIARIEKREFQAGRTVVAGLGVYAMAAFLTLLLVLSALG